MTKQQKIGVAIFVILLVLGVTFKLFDPIFSLGWLAWIFYAVYAEIAVKPKPQNKYPTIEDIQRKYPKRKSHEQIKAEKLKERQAAYDRDFANRNAARGASQPTAPPKNTDSAKYKKLLAMLAGNRETADRLVATYGIDKAISDLERDRL